MRFFLLAAKFFNQGYKEIFSLIQSNRWQGDIFYSLSQIMLLNLYQMYSNLPQNGRGGSTLKEKFSSSRCQRDKEINLWEFILPMHFKSLESVGPPASTLGGRVLPYPQDASRQTNWLKGHKKISGLLNEISFCWIFLFRNTKKCSHWSNSGRGYTLKKKFSSSRWQGDIFYSLSQIMLLNLY